MGEKMQYKDILYETRGSAVWITINRPDKYNAFRGVTCEELIHAINRAGFDKSVAAIVLTGAGEKAFCTGGDQSAHDGGYDGRGTIGLPVEELQSSIRDVPKPMIARVNGFAIETRKSEPRPTRSEHGVAVSVQFGEEQKSRSPRGPSSEISEGTVCFLQKYFWRAIGAACPPIVRYGTVLRAVLTSNTMPYQQKFL